LGSGAFSVPTLYHSIAFSQPSCTVGTFLTTSCNTNNYDYALRTCDNLCPQESIAGHLKFEICRKQTQGLFYCNLAQYDCTITGLTLTTLPNEDAFIEWYYHISYGVPAPVYFLTGKMSFSASATYINNMFNQYGAGGPGGLGIPMFVQSNFNA
jgi:hypothetical protein